MMLVALLVFIVLLCCMVARNMLNGMRLEETMDKEFLAQQLMMADMKNEIVALDEQVKALHGVKAKLYGEAFIEKCIGEVASGKAIRAAARDNGIPYSTLKQWVKKSKQYDIPANDSKGEEVLQH